KAHSACIECHAEIRPGPTGKYCGMCHASTVALRPFPNPNVELSQFADRYSHKAHKDYYDNNPDTFKTASLSRPGGTHNIFGTATTFGPADIVRVSFVAPPAEKGLRCTTCHVPATGGSKMQLPVHANCFECHGNEKIVSKKADTYALNCVGCHANMAQNDPTVDANLKAVKDAVNAVAPIINPFRYVITPSGKANAPFNHVGGAAKYHLVLKPDEGKNAGKTIEGKAACLFCHTSTERAGNRAQMQAFAPKKTDPQLTQPPASACLACHVHAAEMMLPAKPTKLGRAGCMVCHTAADAAKDPPATHMSAEAAPAAPAAKPETAPSTKPETAAPPATKPAATPAPAKPAPAKPAPAKPETPKVETPKPETKPAATEAPKTTPKPAPAEAPKPEAKPAPEAPKPAPQEAPKPEVKPAPAETPKPAPAAGGNVDYSKGYPATAPGSSHMSLPNPMLLGDPKTSDQWGLDAQWGISKLTHQDHTEKYKVECATCHHTNGKGNAAIGEQVERCVTCHRAEGDEKNPTNKDGDEIWVKNAFHLGESGCIECHKRDAAKNPSSKAPTGCAGCHAPKSAGVDPFLTRPETAPVFGFGVDATWRNAKLWQSGFEMFDAKSSRYLFGRAPRVGELVASAALDVDAPGTGARATASGWFAGGSVVARVEPRVVTLVSSHPGFAPPAPRAMAGPALVVASAVSRFELPHRVA
ncbi:MAG: cytochrome c3 family protein, partial [Vicinamibacterales bacterium]